MRREVSPDPVSNESTQAEPITPKQLKEWAERNNKRVKRWNEGQAKLKKQRKKMRKP